ncbi:MAG: hypothetical protein ACOCRK_04510 [bacterium]
MFIKTNSTFKIVDYYNNKNEITFISNKKPNFNLLKESKTLEVNRETKKMLKTAKVVKVAPKEGDFLYVRNRAISAGNAIENKDGTVQVIPIDDLYKDFERFANKVRGANDNGDFFSHEELIKHYKTFIGKAAFVDHDNENVEKARGIILDAVYNDKGKFVELLKAVDKKAYPELARGIELGYITDTSMGCRCGHSLCSICGNKAVTEEDFCDHVINYKGTTYNGLPVWEDNRDVDFFEDSFVTTGADPDAKILEKVAHKYKHLPIIKTNKSKYNNELMTKIASETNQRLRDGRIKSFTDKLNNLPWT